MIQSLGSLDGLRGVSSNALNDDDVRRQPLEPSPIARHAAVSYEQISASAESGRRAEGGREREGAAAERPRTWIVLQYESYLCRNGYMCRNGYLYMYMCGNWFCASYCRYGVLLNYMYST